MGPSVLASAQTPLGILLVEDNPGDVRLIQDMLGGFPVPGCRLASRNRISEARRYLEAERPQVILMDLGLPDACGLEALEALRELGTGIPVVVLTSLDDEGFAHRALEEGAQDYLVKGRFDGEMLLRSMRYAMDRQRREAALQASEARTRKMVEACLIGLVLADEDGGILEANRAYLDLLGAASLRELPRGGRWDALVQEADSEAHAQAVAALRGGRGHPPWEVTFLRPDGSSVPVLLGAARFEGPPHGFVAYAMDISERRSLLERLQREAREDALTGLRNRRAFLELLELAVTASHRHGHPMSLALCDLDGFKQINDRHGHAAGDEVLRAFGDILTLEVRGTDVAARLGGDEFCILFAHSPAALAGRSLERVRRCLAGRRFLNAEGQPFFCSASFGLVDLHPGIQAPEGLLQLADEALYRAKKAGRNRVEGL